MFQTRRLVCHIYAYPVNYILHSMLCTDKYSQVPGIVNRTQSKRKNQSNPNERSIFELMICVKQALKIHNGILEAQVTWARSVAFFVNKEILQK